MTNLDSVREGRVETGWLGVFHWSEVTDSDTLNGGSPQGSLEFRWSQVAPVVSRWQDRLECNIEK